MKPIRNFLKNLFKQRVMWLMVLPGILYVIIFNYVPMAGVVMAFQKLDLNKGVFTSPWVGLNNFKFLFTTSDAWIMTRNTILYHIAFTATGLICAIALAVVIHELTNRRFSKVMQTVIMMPHFLSIVVVATIVYAFLNPTYGFVNSMLTKFGISRVNWYMMPKVWPPLLVFLNLWKGVGYSSVIYVAVLAGIPEEYYEAALMDGAKKLQQFRFITLPHLKFIISINLIRSMGSMLKSGLGWFYNVPRDSGMLYPVTQTIDTYVYRGLTNSANLGMTAAAAFYQSFVGMILILVVNKIVSKIDNDAALF